MRTKYAIKNISMSIFSQVIIILLGFISRKIFLDSLGTEYLGVNGVLTNVLSAMVLIEGGIGISIVYNLYKPLAEDNREQIISLVQLYRKTYNILALIVFTICCIIYPFITYLLKTDKEIPGLFVVYWIFVAKNVLSYVFAYKWALINADQKGYVLTKNNLIFQIIAMVFKIIILKTTRNYILFLLIEFAVFIIQNIYNTIVVNKMYSYVNCKKKYSIEKSTKSNIVSNVKAMFIQNIGSYAITSTDNILISAFINVATVGLYSNYTLIIGQLTTLLNQIIGGIGAGVGNLIATENKDKIYSIFKSTYLVSFWIYSWSTIFLFNLLEPFISWCFGSQYILEKGVFIVILLNFYLSGMRGIIVTFKRKAGLFAQDKYANLIEGIINLVLSLVFIKYLGLAGVFLGTTLSYILLSFWNQPRIVYKMFFNRPINEYFYRYIEYTFLMLIMGVITTVICNFIISGYSFLSLIIRGIICLLIPNLILIVVFHKNDEFIYLLNIIKIYIPNKLINISIRKKQIVNK